MQLAAQTERFRDVRLYGFTHEYDPANAKQFDALSFLVPDGTLFVAYMGTDTSLAGWKEDFNMSFLSAVPAQERGHGLRRGDGGHLPGSPAAYRRPQQGRQPGCLGGAAHPGGAANLPPAGCLQQRWPGLPATWWKRRNTAASPTSSTPISRSPPS